MANRIDSGEQPTAHSAFQAMIVRAHQLADQTGQAIGVHYDLATDELSLVEIGPDTPDEASFVRIAIPASKDDRADDSGVVGQSPADVPEIKTAPA